MSHFMHLLFINPFEWPSCETKQPPAVSTAAATLAVLDEAVAVDIVIALTTVAFVVILMVLWKWLCCHTTVLSFLLSQESITKPHGV